MTSNDFQSDLIFDLGMHKALDTKYYLDKGFRVVALEANPKMVTAATAAHAKEIETGQLIILSCAFWSAGGQTISFFLNSVKDDWSSGFKEWAEKGGHASAEITVATVTLARLFDLYGVPYYIKCDIEGADELFVRQLLADRRRPAFVSIEAISLDALALLFAAGYDCVQIVNQAFNGFVEPPTPAREGKYVPIQFNGHMSGLFGRELDPKGWLTFSEAAQNYMDFSRLTERDEKLAHGWLDFHLTSNAIIQHLSLGS